MSCEEWRIVPGFPMHMVSSEGRIFSWYSQRFLKPGIGSHGYPKINLGFRKTRLVHVIVAEAFFGPRPVGHDVLHGDGNRTNPNLKNLRYGTRAENNADMVLHRTHSGFSATARRKAVETRDKNYPGWRQRSFGRS